MDINQVLTEYDNMFGRKDLSEIEAYLASKIDEAYAEQDYASAVTLLNEIIGFCLWVNNSPNTDIPRWVIAYT